MKYRKWDYLPFWLFRIFNWRAIRKARRSAHSKRVIDFINNINISGGEDE